MHNTPSDDGGKPGQPSTHRICRQCGATKLLSEFGVRRNNPDNTDHMCKVCRNKSSRRYGKQWVQQEPWSTSEARRILTTNGIPCITGRACGKPKVDLMAWACVPIEAKASMPTYTSKAGAQSFEFGFSRTQVNMGVPGLVIFFTRLDERRYRWFVVPGNSPIVRGKAHVTVTVNSTSSLYWQLMQPYESRLDMIEEMRLQFVATGNANEYPQPPMKIGRR